MTALIVIVTIVVWIVLLAIGSASLSDVSGMSPFAGMIGFLAVILAPVWVIDRVGKSMLPSSQREEMKDRQRRSPLYNFAVTMMATAIVIGILVTLGVFK